MKLPKIAYCINLKDRTNRWDSVKKNWTGIFPIERIEAVDCRLEKDGMKGAYLSHLKTMVQYLLTEDYKNGFPLLIIEDDAVPCKDFNTRLNKIWSLLPNNWDVFLPGFWPNQFSEWEKVNAFIYKAKKQVVGNHCWIINCNVLPMLITFFEDRPHRNVDDVMREIQQCFNMYIAIPSFSHQVSSWSDTSDQPSYTDPTRIYFKEIL
jgi:GR25 family glycosyltransferase involved in LPS biosynthesis